MDRINDVVEQHQWDMTILAFWMSNATLLLHYLKKDAGLVQATGRFQLELSELISEIFILIIRDAERRMDKVLGIAVLEHETIPGLEDIAFQGEWKVFKSKSKTPELPPEKRFRPPSPKRRAQTSPRNITSLLSSALFVLDLYDVHSVITSQILAQLFYWLGAELFNQVMTTKRYLSRTKAMQIRMNVSALEDWARSNNRQPEHYENGSTTTTGESVVEAARRHLNPVIQLLQWLQCFTSLGEDHESLVGTLTQLQRLTPTQLIHAVKNYRPEVGEKGLPKAHMKFLVQLQKGQETLIRRPLTPVPADLTPSASGIATPVTTKMDTTSALQQNGMDGSSSPAPTRTSTTTATSHNPVPSILPPFEPDSDPPGNKNQITIDPSLMLPFSLPTSTDMLITYGAGIGGTNRERARKYIPTVPTEVLSKLNLDGRDGQSLGRKTSTGTVGTTAQGWRNGNVI
jgi:DIL domain